ncbi:MAG: phage tail protein [Moraxellaceae bacterium]|nr:phage tail protein [Moraxellaceae bacterium]
MDANGQRFWLLADAAHWPQRSHVHWDAGCRALSLASERTLPPPADLAASETDALAALNEVPRAVDESNVVVTWWPVVGETPEETTHTLVVRSHLPQAALALTLAAQPNDLAIGGDGVLYVALPDGVLVHDLRERWADVTVRLAGFTPWRLACDASGGAWVLERDSGRLARLAGYPLPAQTPQSEDYAGTVFRPDPENCHAPALRLMTTPPWPAGERVQALAAHADGGVALLSWSTDPEAPTRLWRRVADAWQAPITLQGATHAYALAWLDATRIVVRMPGRPDAPAFSLDAALGSAARLPLGDIFPLAGDAMEAGFAHHIEGVHPQPHYPVRHDAAEPLLPLSLPNLARTGSAANYRIDGSGDAGEENEVLRAHLIDSGTPATVWHRVYAEAMIPAHGAFVLWLAATNDAQPPATDDLEAWHPHLFGRDLGGLGELARYPQLPRAVWEPLPSELPGHPGLARWQPEPGTRGLFSVLVQNARQRVRSLSGRYLWVQLALQGDGRSGPEVVALRAYGSRFSYAEQYLPRVYRETLFGDAARQPGELLVRIDESHAVPLDAGGIPDALLLERLAEDDILPGAGARVVVEKAGSSWLLFDGTSSRCWRLRRESHAVGVYRPQSSRADFLGRMLGNFEGVLTQIEDRIAAAHLLTDPTAIPEENLDWLAAWVGIAFDPALPAKHRRAWLEAAPQLARWHGTRRGLALALDIATGGAVAGGEIILLEDFRLRRILATLLGVDLADEEDPLLPGLQQSGNSVVGDTLVLGDAERAELMALYREEATSAAEDRNIAAFYGRLAHRATVLVHREVEAMDFGLIRRIVELATPAHVDTRVVAATWPFLVGIASLVGVDSYLARPLKRRPARVQVSAIGMGDYVLGPGSLDPRLRGEAAPPVDTRDGPPALPASTPEPAPRKAPAARGATRGSATTRPSSPDATASADSAPRPRKSRKKKE